MVQSRPQAHNQAASQPPDDFEVGSSERLAVWNALPPSVKAYIRSGQSRQLGFKALADLAWGSRFKEAHEYKTAVLQKAHTLELKRVRDDWDANRLSAEHPPKEHSIRSLDSSLVERILEHVPGGSSPGCAHAGWEYVRHESRSDEWQGRRVYAQVCKLFEALAYTRVERVCFAASGEGYPAGNPEVPPSFILRDIERAVLSPRLRRIDICIPHCPARDEVSVLAAVLPRCPALEHLKLMLLCDSAGASAGEVKQESSQDSNGEVDQPAREDGNAGDANNDRSQQVAIPKEITDSLQRCQPLVHLQVAALWVNGENDTGELPIMHVDSIKRFAAALIAMPTLRELALEGLSFDTGEDDTLDTLSDALSQCKSLRALRLFHVYAPSGWPPFVALTQLTAIDIEEGGWRLHDEPPPLEHIQFCSGLEALRLSLDPIYVYGEDTTPHHLAREKKLAHALPSMPTLHTAGLDLAQPTLEGHAAIADALCKLPELRRVEFGACGLDVAKLMLAALPACAALRELQLSLDSQRDGDAWLEAVAQLLPQCRRLAALTVREQARPAALLHAKALWARLPMCAGLEALELRGLRLDNRDVCVLCPVLEQCPSLRRLAILGSGLGEDELKLVAWVAKKMRVHVEFDSG